MRISLIVKRILRLKTSRGAAGGFLRFYSNSFSSPRSRSRRRRIPFACRSPARFFKRVLWATPLSPNYPPESLGVANLLQYLRTPSGRERGFCTHLRAPDSRAGAVRVKGRRADNEIRSLPRGNNPSTHPRQLLSPDGHRQMQNSRLRPEAVYTYGERSQTRIGKQYEKMEKTVRESGRFSTLIAFCCVKQFTK